MGAARIHQQDDRKVIANPLVMGPIEPLTDSDDPSFGKFMTNGSRA
jgi:hypothetical protein